MYDGETVDVPYISPGVRSQLGESLWADFHHIIREGLYGGVLNTGWPLLDLESRRPSLKYKGLKKFHEKKLHQLQYKPSKGVNYRIALYFEPETFRHVASSYHLSTDSGTMRTRTVDLDAGARGAAGPTARGIGHLEVHSDSSRYQITLEESFENFKAVDGLILPHDCQITVTLNRKEGSFEGHWEMRFDRITHDSAIDPKTFSIK